MSKTFPHIQVDILQPGGQWKFAGFLIAGALPQMQGFVYREQYDGIPLDPIHLDYLHEGRRFRGGGTLGDGTLPNILHVQLPGVFARKVIQRVNPEFLRAPEIKQLFTFGSVTRGALRLTFKGNFPDAPQFRGWNEMESARKAAVDAYLGRLKEIPGAMVRAFSAGESGARPKANVRLQDGAEWIAKFNAPGDGFNVARVEHLVHRVTQRAGIEGVQSRVVQISGDDTLLMRRYDRDKSGAPIYRIPLSVLVGRENNNPENYGTIDYLDYREVLLRIAPQEVGKLYQMMIFHAALNDTDNHAGNLEVLACPDGSWRLAPAFDILPDPGRAVFATSMCRYPTRPRSAADWEDFIINTAEKFGVSPHLATPILRAVAEIRNVAAEDHKFAPNEQEVNMIVDALCPDHLKKAAQRVEAKLKTMPDLSTAVLSPIS